MHGNMFKFAHSSDNLPVISPFSSVFLTRSRRCSCQPIWYLEDVFMRRILQPHFPSSYHNMLLPRSDFPISTVFLF